MQAQKRDWRWMLAFCVNLPSRITPTLLVQCLLAISVIVLMLAPAGTAARFVPIVGTMSLALEFVYLSRLMFRLYTGLSANPLADGRSAFAPNKRYLFAAINSLFGLMVFTLMFYPMSHAIIDAAPVNGTGRVLWMLTVGGAVVTLSFGQMVSLMLDAMASAQTLPSRSAATPDAPAP